jgi:hypothetical protein
MALTNFNFKEKEKFAEIHYNHIPLYFADGQKSKT